MGQIPTDKTLQEQYRKLPPSIKRVIEMEGLDKVFKEVADRNHLRVDEAGEMVDETYSILFGLKHPQEFVDNMQKAMPSTPRDKVERLARDINGSIFAPIHKALRDFHAQEPSTKEQMSGVRPPPGKPIPREERHVSPPRPEKPAPSSTERSVPKNTETKGLERSMPKDVAMAKLSGQVQIPREEKRFFEKGGYAGNDPYRESIDENNK